VRVPVPRCESFCRTPRLLSRLGHGKRFASIPGCFPRQIRKGLSQLIELSRARNRRTFGLVWVFLLASSQHFLSQSTATYHLHREASSTGGLFQLKTAGPDTASLAIQSADLKNQPAGEYLVKAFDTAVGVPNGSGTIAAGATVSFTLWMKKTANFGTMVPRAKLSLNSAAGTALCAATGASALSHSSISSYTLNCTTATAITVASSDRLYVWVGVNMTAGPGNKTVTAELDVEGTLNGNYDSRLVVPLPNLAPTVSVTAPANNATFLAGANITINAAAADGDGTVSKVEFFQGSTKLGEDTTSPYSYTWNNVSLGSYALTAKATDNAGATTTSNAVNISVTLPNSPPTVSITSPANNASFAAGSNITIAATAADSDGTITKVEFFQGSTKLGEATASPYSFAWSNVPTGNCALTGKATDNVGSVTTSGVVNVAVTSISWSDPSSPAKEHV
jgi:Bacterial Ig domain